LKNVLLIVVDCLRADYIYRRKALIPNIKKLLRTGYSFLNTIVTTTTTPSFASLITGLYPFENGVRSHSGFALKSGIISFPELLAKKGYNTYAEITGPLVNEIGLWKGFKEYNYRDRKQVIYSKWGEKLIDKIKSQYKSPWFLTLHIWALHEPRIILDRFKSKRYGKNNYARAISSIDYFIGQILDVVDENTFIIFTSDHGEQVSKFKLEYKVRNRLVKYIQKFQKKGILRKPFAKLVRQFYIGHGYSIYDVLVKIPLIFKDKDDIPHGLSSVQVRQIDIFPTILDILNISIEKERTGKSLLPIIKGEENRHRDAYMEAVGIVIPNKKDWLAGIRIDNKYKYIYSSFRRDYKEELYLLDKDPNKKKMWLKTTLNSLKL